MGSTGMPPQELTLPQNKDASTNVDIAVIDLSSWTEASLSGKTSMAATWHQAFSTHGLVWLVGHGLGPLYQHVADQWSHFCDQDDEEKRKYSALWYGSSGYNAQGAEAVARSEGGPGEPDPVESLESGYQDQFGGPFPRAANGYPGGDSLIDPCFQLYCQLVLKVLHPCLNCLPGSHDGGGQACQLLDGERQHVRSVETCTVQAQRESRFPSSLRGAHRLQQLHLLVAQQDERAASQVERILDPDSSSPRPSGRPSGQPGRPHGGLDRRGLEVSEAPGSSLGPRTRRASFHCLVLRTKP